MSADEPPAGPGRERLRDAEHVLHGPGGSGAWRQLLYVVYVVSILAGLYGFTVLRALVEVVGPRWAADGLVVPTRVALALAAVAVVALVRLAGRRRGPVTPDLAWVDLVVASPVDRRLALREAWLLPWTGLIAVGTVLGGVVGAALWGGGAAGPVTAVVGLVGGGGYGVLLALVWLAGQVAGDPAGDRHPAAAAPALAVRPGRALRALGLEGLRAHSARSSRLGGAVLAGDPRALRLEAASPVRRGRRWRLRSRGPVRTVVARDVLGLRRQPVLLVAGGALVVAGSSGLAWVLAEPSAPVLGAAVAVLVWQGGVGVWAEGLRLLGDTLGSPRLLGGSVAREAVAHSVVPGGLALLVAGATLAGWSAVADPDGGTVAAAVVAVPALAAVCLAAQWVAAFRVLPPELALLPEAGPQVLVVWLAWPVVLAVAAGTLAVVRVAGVAHGAPVVPAALVVVVAVGALSGLASRALSRAAVAHRD
ncbi:hypothetical protein [Phycicoccus flavus]|uniref:Uncharacterized protein n=1 Tax=Phycicoccus flavus TaxID=2502783 RepID=A0A8T6R317_9MICO|nr:hypothetical protein [Phycicoccus flavus]NHA67890.1 hypothetical protein [Phycicoccus flavus]